MDTPTPDVENVTPGAKRTIKMVPEYLLTDSATDAALFAYDKVISGLLMAFENLAAEGQTVNQIQQTEIMKSVMFCMRDLDSELDSSNAFGVAVHDSYFGKTEIPASDKMNQQFKDLFEFDPTDPDAEASEDVKSD